MPTPASREELINAIETNFERPAKDLKTVPVQENNKAALLGHVKGTMMSVYNPASYLLGWKNLVLKWIEKDAGKGESIDFPETGYNWNQLGALAQKFYADYDAVPLYQLLKDPRICQAENCRFHLSANGRATVWRSLVRKVYHGPNDPTQYVFAVCQCSYVPLKMEAAERYCVM